MSLNNTPEPPLEEVSSTFKNAVAMFKTSTIPPFFEEVVGVFEKTPLFENM